MNDIRHLFDELFCKEENRQTALLYLSSLMGHTEDPQDLPIKLQQASLLRAYLESSEVPHKEFYMEMVADILQILSKVQHQGGSQ